MEQLQNIRNAVAGNVQRVVVGQASVVELMLIALLAEGHVLIEGVPGLAKTLLARSFAATLAMAFGRVQFTPDLMPGDILGTNLFNFQTNQFALTKGPIFTNVLLADEINRTPPKTQAALLQAMQERQVTIDGTTHELPETFFVVATQNPIEQEGTYPLPEAQLDRFLFKLVVGYPSRDDERDIVRRHGARQPAEAPALAPVLAPHEVLALRVAVRDITLAEPIVDYIVDLVRATRERPELQTGASPRAAAALALAARVRAALQGRAYVVPDDVKALCLPALRHRVVLAPGAELDGVTVDAALAQLLESVAAPR